MPTDVRPLRWYYARDRQKVGPVTAEELRELTCRGELKPTDMLLPEGASRWLAAAEVLGPLDQARTGSSDWATQSGSDALPPPPGTTMAVPPQVQDAARAGVGPPAGAAVPGYEILGVLGQGGMGVVYKARQTSLNRLVALKMIRSGAHAGSHERARFLVEAEAVARLSHPNIVQIHEIGEHDGCPFFSLEFVEGGSLDRKIAGTPQPPRDVAVLVESLARAMQHAHAQGVIHRDLKPANVLLSRIEDRGSKIEEDKTSFDPRSRAPEGSIDPRSSIPKITDFGLARQLADDQRLTQTGAVMGSPSYMAPEQARGQGHEIGPLTDVYGLGAILYEMLTGRPPFKGANTADTLLLVTTAEPVPPRQLAPRIPRDLETICLKCLQKEPSRRYRSSGDLADDLRRFLDNRPIRARPLGPVARTARWCRRNPVLAAVTALLGVALVVGVSGIVWQWRRAEDNAENEREQRQRAEERELANLRFVYAARMSQVPQDWENGDVAAVDRHLEAFLPGPGQKHDVRGYEWYRYRQMTRGSRFTLHGHAHEIDALAFSADGRLLASGSYDTQVRIWDTTTGKERDVITLGSRVNALAFTPDGRALFIASGVTSDVRAYDVDNKVLGPQQVELRPWPVRGKPVRRLLVSADGRFLFANSHPVRVHAVAGGKLVATVNLETPDLALTPDGRTVICAVGGSIEMHGVQRDWDREAVKLLHRVEAHADEIARLTLSRDGKTLVTLGADRTTKLWSLEGAGKPPVLRATLKDHPAAVSDVALSPDGKQLFTAGLDRVIRAWEVPSMRLLGSLRGHAKEIYRLAVSPDGKQLASGGMDASVKVWDLAELAANSSASRPGSRGFFARAIAFSPDDRLLATGGADAVVRVWDLEARRERFALREHTDEVMGVAFPPGGQELLSVSRDGVACCWQLEGGGLVRRRKLEGEITCCAATPDGTALACGDMDGRVWLLGPDGAPRLPTGAHRPHQTRVSALAFSPDGKTLLSGAWDGSVALTDVTTGVARPCPPQLLNAIDCVTFSGDGKQVLASDHGEYCAAWDPATRAPIGERYSHRYTRPAVVRHPRGEWLLWASDFGGEGKLVKTDRPRSGDANENSLPASEQAPLVAGTCSHDGARVAVTDWYGGITLCDVAGWRTLFRLPGHARALHSVTFSPDGKWLAHAAGCRVCLLDAVARRELAILTGHEDVVSSVAFSPDGHTLATASWDRTVRLWDVSSGKPGAVLRATLPVRALAFAPDGRTLASGGGQMNSQVELLLWDARTASLRARLPARRWMVRGLAFAPDGQTLFSVSGDGWQIPGDLTAWDVESGQERLSLVAHSSPVGAVALSPGGRLLATAGTMDGVLRLWDVRGPETITLRHTLRGVGQVHGLALAPNGRTLAVVGSDRFIHLWQPELGQSVGRLDCPVGALALVFSPDGRTLAVGEASGQLRLLDAAAPDEVRRETAATSTADPTVDLQAETERLGVLARRNLASFLAGEGDAAGEKEALEQALAELDRLAAGAPELRSLQLDQVKLLRRLVLLKGVDAQARERFAARAAEVAGKLLAADPSVPQHTYQRADSLRLLGYTHYAARHQDEALAAAEAAVALFRRLLEQNPENPGNHEGLAAALDQLGHIQEERKQPEQAIACYRAAAASSEVLARSYSFNEECRRQIASALGRFLTLSSPQKGLDAERKRELADALRRYCDLLDQQVVQSPSDLPLRARAADWHRFWHYRPWHGFVFEGVISPDEADDSYHRAVAHYAALVKLRPGEVAYRKQRATAFKEWGNMLDGKKQYGRAEKVYAALAEECKALKEREPQASDLHVDHCEALRLHAGAVAEQSRHEEAARLLREALRLSREAIAAFGKQDRLQGNLAVLLRALADVELRRKDHAAAGTALEECVALPVEDAVHWLRAGELLGSCERLARKDDRLSAQQKEQAAKRYLDGAMTALRKAVEDEPEVRFLLERNPALDGLRQREDFKKLLKE
jgi:WD40 repeat protein/serine/threonine protein kinase/tetratricopeptide (TPR) repeat protein